MEAPERSGLPVTGTTCITCRERLHLSLVHSIWIRCQGHIQADCVSKDVAFATPGTIEEELDAVLRHQVQPLRHEHHLLHHEGAQRKAATLLPPARPSRVRLQQEIPDPRAEPSRVAVEVVHRAWTNGQGGGTGGPALANG